MTCLRCGEPVQFKEIVNHVRLFHPDAYEPGLEAWPVEVEVALPELDNKWAACVAAFGWTPSEFDRLPVEITFTDPV